MKVAVQEVVFFFCCSLLLILFSLLQHGCSTGCSSFWVGACSIMGPPHAAVPSGVVPDPVWVLHNLQSLQECIFSTVTIPPPAWKPCLQPCPHQCLFPLLLHFSSVVQLPLCLKYSGADPPYAPLFDALLHSGLFPLVSEPSVADYNGHMAVDDLLLHKEHPQPLAVETFTETLQFIPQISHTTTHFVCVCVLMQDKDFGRPLASWWDQGDVLTSYACSQERARDCPSKFPLFSASPWCNPPLSTCRLTKRFSERT